MSSTTGIQNLLVNVFRPVYRYETPVGDSNTIFIPKLTMSNIDTYSGNAVSVFTAAVGDSNSNVYVGSNAGNPYTTVKACSNVTALGFSAAAGISNVTNSVFVGYNAGNGASTVSNNVIIGASATGNGSSNVRIGSSNVGTLNSSSNVSIGASTSTSSYSNCVLLGPGITATQNNQLRVGSSYLWGDLSNKWLGIGTSSPYDVNNKLDVSGNLYVKGQQGINMVPVRTLDINGNLRMADDYGGLDFNLGDFTVYNNFTSIVLSNDGTTYLYGGLKRFLNTSAIVQPVIQYGKDANGSGNSGNVTVTLPAAYTSSSSYVVQVTMGDSTPAQVSAVNVSSNSFTIYWSGAGAGSHTIVWTTYGT